jgi:hypothetical protein
MISNVFLDFFMAPKITADRGGGQATEGAFLDGLIFDGERYRTATTWHSVTCFSEIRLRNCFQKLLPTPATSIIIRLHFRRGFGASTLRHLHNRAWCFR